MPESTTAPPGTEQLLMPGDAAKLCGVTVHTLARWVREGRMSSYILPGGHRRYRTDDILAMRGTLQGVIPKSSSREGSHDKPEH